MAFFAGDGENSYSGNALLFVTVRANNAHGCAGACRRLGLCSHSNSASCAGPLSYGRDHWGRMLPHTLNQAYP